MKNNYQRLGLAGILAIVNACGDNETPKEPDIKNFECLPALVSFPIGHEAYLHDEDCDGHVDSVAYGFRVFAVKPNYEGRFNGIRDINTAILSSEAQRMADAMLIANKEISHKLAQMRYFTGDKIRFDKKL